MNYFVGKTAKLLFLSTLFALALGATAFAADLPSGVGAITGSSVRMRAEASTSASILVTLDKGDVIALYGDEANGWYAISRGGKSGFVSADYVVVDQDGVFETYGRINAEGVNVREQAGIDSAALATINADSIVTVTGFTNGWYAVTCKYGTQGFIRCDFVDLTSNDGTSSSGIIAAAQQHLGTRYVYGGAAPGGFDCSGFTMYIYNQYGVSLPHTASGQWQSGKGTQIWSVGALTPGDLVFFCDPSRSNGKACSHTGIYVGNGQFIHASSSRSGGVIYSSLYDDYYARYFVGGLHIL